MTVTPPNNSSPTIHSPKQTCPSGWSSPGGAKPISTSRAAWSMKPTSKMEGCEARIMLSHVTMQVSLPPDMPPGTAEKIRAAEKSYAQELQRQGKWIHLWRVAGRYSNISIFDVSSHDELHALLSGLPLYPYLDINVTPLARHPSAIQQTGTATHA